MALSGLSALRVRMVLRMGMLLAPRTEAAKLTMETATITKSSRHHASVKYERKPWVRGQPHVTSTVVGAVRGGGVLTNAWVQGVSGGHQLGFVALLVRVAIFNNLGHTGGPLLTFGLVKMVPAIAYHLCSIYPQHSRNHVRTIKGSTVFSIFL